MKTSNENLPREVNKTGRLESPREVPRELQIPTGANVVTKKQSGPNARFFFSRPINVGVFLEGVALCDWQ